MTNLALLGALLSSTYLLRIHAPGSKLSTLMSDVSYNTIISIMTTIILTIK